MDHLLRATARAEARHFWFRGFRAFVLPLIQHALAGRSTIRILDCGCGTGANVGLLGRFGRAYGFDLTETGLQLGREAGRNRLVRASVTAVPFPSASFDLITSFDVLYSLEGSDERTALREMFRLLKPGGYALINVAALEILRGDHSVLGRELRRYNRADLRDHVVAAGFDIERLTYTNATLAPVLAVQRTYQRWRGLKPEEEAHQEISIPPAPVNGLLTGVLWLESLWIRRFNAPFGSSLLCLARKPAVTESNGART
jgi:ubiquinone/menaquinone biosynthesis C-methylase UbiE